MPKKTIATPFGQAPVEVEMVTEEAQAFGNRSRNKKDSSVSESMAKFTASLNPAQRWEFYKIQDAIERVIKEGDKEVFAGPVRGIIPSARWKDFKALAVQWREEFKW